MNAVHQTSPSLNPCLSSSKNSSPKKTIPRPKPKFPFGTYMQGVGSQKLANSKYMVDFGSCASDEVQ